MLSGVCGRCRSANVTQEPRTARPREHRTWQQWLSLWFCAVCAVCVPRSPFARKVCCPSRLVDRVQHSKKYKRPGSPQAQAPHSEHGIPALRLRESVRRVLRRTIVPHVPAERAHGTGPAPKAKLLGPLAGRGRHTAAGAPVLPWGETARVVAWSAAAWSVWRHRAGWREALWSVWRHRVGWREARGGHPGGRRRLHLKTHIF